MTLLGRLVAWAAWLKRRAAPAIHGYWGGILAAPARLIDWLRRRG